MEREIDKSNLLLDEIKKELNAIIEEGPEDNKASNSKTNFEKKQHGFAYKDNSDITLKSNISDSIGDSLQIMQKNLDESYKFFQNIGERFENINFNCLKSRISDLKLNEHKNDSIKAVVDDLRNSFDEKYMQNRMEDLTKDVATKFRKHPGEFGDIPELSEFFTTCTQLQRGLEKLQKYKDGCIDLEKKVFQVAEASYNRVSDIQRKLNIDKCRSEEQTEENDEIIKKSLN